MPNDSGNQPPRPTSGAPPPPGKERAGPTAKDRPSKVSHHADRADCTAGSDIPVGHPWSSRRDGLEVEARFRRDRECWRRRVLCARRLAYDAADEVAPSGSWNALEEIGAER
jgi:hypothetical protein